LLSVGPWSCRIGPALCPGQRSYETTKPGFFMCILYCSIFCSGGMFAFVVLGLVSSVLAKRLAGKNVSEMTCFVSNGSLNLNSYSVTGFLRAYAVIHQQGF